MGVAVVCPAAVSRHHLQLRRGCRHLQGADRLGDRVVAANRRGGLARALLAAEHDRVAVRRAADLRDRARHREVGALVVLVARHRARRRQRRAVVLLAVRAGRDRQSGRGHRQLALLLRLVAVLVAVRHRVAERVRHVALGHMRDRSACSGGDRHHVAR